MADAGPVEREREQVAEACRRLAREGLVIGMAGNVSARAGERVAVTATGAVFEDLGPDEVTVVDGDGRVDGEGLLEPTSELALHLGVYREVEAAGAVVHTHAPMATALSCVLDEVPAIHYQMLALGGAVPVVPYATFGTQELADAVVDALRARTAALMRNHGAICWAADVPAAVDLALLLEWACTLYWRARMIGEPAALTDEQLGDVLAAVQQRGYGTTRAAGT